MAGIIVADSGPLRSRRSPLVTINQTSLIKRRRSTKAEVEERREALLDIIDQGKGNRTERAIVRLPAGSRPGR